MEIIAVYQDCVLCGIKGRKKAQEYAEKGIVIRKVGFTTDEGRKLCAQALTKGIGTMPFYVCGGDFATTIDAFIFEKTKTPKTRKKSIKKQIKAKEIKDGNTPKN